MTVDKKNIGHRILRFLNIGLLVAYLLSCLNSFLSAGTFWFIAIIGLIFPFLFLTVLLLLIFWLFKNRKYALMHAIVLLIGLQQIIAFLPFRFSQQFDLAKDPSAIRILSWNVSRWDDNSRERTGGDSFRRLMLDLVEQQKADVLCFQEFFECYEPGRCDPTIEVIKKMGYPYHYFFPSSKIYEGKSQFGLAIFSKFPMTDSAQFIEGAGQHGEGFCYVDLKIGEKKIRVVTTHLESVGFSHEDRTNVGSLGTANTILSKIKRSYAMRSNQADLLRRELDITPYPLIVCGDLDDVPNSYTYFKTKGSLQDVFLKKGAGLGGTVRFISPTLRIDYIFVAKSFDIEQFKQIDVAYSDHLPLVVDIVFRN